MAARLRTLVAGLDHPGHSRECRPDVDITDEVPGRRHLAGFVPGLANLGHPLVTEIRYLEASDLKRGTEGRVVNGQHELGAGRAVRAGVGGGEVA